MVAIHAGRNKAEDAREGSKPGASAGLITAVATKWVEGWNVRSKRYHRAMLLALDIGNTNVTLGLVNGETVMASRRAATRPASTPDELEMLIDGLLRIDGASMADVTGISLASVVPQLATVSATVADRRGLPILIAGPGNVPMPIRVQRPAEVGPDRLVNSIAVARLYGTPAVVIDFGTATTFDCVSRDGAYVGGAIAPGLELGLEALASRTARLPRIELNQPEKAIGTDTVSAMQSGVVLGYRAMTEGLLERIRTEMAHAEHVDPDTIQVVLTGGLSAAPWARSLPGVDAIDTELTLKGLAILWALANGEPGVPGEEVGWAGSAAGSIHIISERDQ
jgi:type III pantothenate kinase